MGFDKYILLNGLTYNPAEYFTSLKNTSISATRNTRTHERDQSDETKVFFHGISQKLNKITECLQQNDGVKKATTYALEQNVVSVINNCESTSLKNN